MEETDTILPENVYETLQELLSTGTAQITKPIHIEYVQSFKLPIKVALAILWRSITRRPVALIGDMEITRDGINLHSQIGRLA